MTGKPFARNRKRPERESVAYWYRRIGTDLEELRAQVDQLEQEMADRIERADSDKDFQAIQEIGEELRALRLADSLAQSWQSLRDAGQGIEDTGRDIAALKDTQPLVALCDLASRGVYPPPELLMAIVERFRAYLGAKGGLNLEEALIEPASQKSGNYATQAARDAERANAAGLVVALQNRGWSQHAAAERVVASLGLDLDPSTLARYARNPLFKPLRKSE